MKIPTNIPQGYKSSPLGTIPKDWEVKRLGEVTTSFSGGTPKSGESKFYGGSIPFIRSGEIHSNSTEMFLTEEGLSNSSAKLVKKGDLLYALYGATSGEVDISQIDGAINQAILCIQSSKVNLRFVFYYLNYKKGYITSKFLQGGQGNLSSDIIMSFLISLPPLAEQERIAELLGTWDKAIEMQKQLIDKLELRKRGLMRQLLTGKKRLPGFTGEWKTRRIIECADRLDSLRIPIAESNREKGSTPYYGANGILGYVQGFTHDGKFILVAEDGANNLCDYPVQYVQGKIWVNNHAHVLQTKHDSDTKFLSYLMKIINYEPYIVGGSRAKLNAQTLMNINVRMPQAKEEQTAIAHVFSSLDCEIQKLAEKRDKYIEEKQGLMQVLLTGKKRI